MPLRDWTEEAAMQIVEAGKWSSVGVIQRIIVVCAAPLVDLLRQTKREHGYLCIKCEMTLAHGGMPVPKDKVEDGTCTCGADEWNAKVDAALAGRP